LIPWNLIGLQQPDDAVVGFDEDLDSLVAIRISQGQAADRSLELPAPQNSALTVLLFQCEQVSIGEN
jgi:hypothetical protein